jgi:hypothetical protein
MSGAAQSRPSESDRFSIFGVTFRGAQIVQSPAADNAKRHVIRSSALGGIVSVLLLAALLWSGVSVSTSLLLAAISAYVAWASYWGTVGIARMLGNDGSRPGQEMAEILMRLCLPLVGPLALIAIGALYGTLGGGASEFLKCREIIGNPGLASE